MKLLKIYFSFRGRLSLLDFWLYWNIPCYLAGVVISYINIDANVWIAITLFSTWPFLATSVKRLHDRDLSGWFLLLHLIPILGSIILFIPIYLTPGTDGKNSYDAETENGGLGEILSDHRTVIITVTILIAFQVLCFLTNKSILGVIYTDGPYYGRVVDAKTKRWIPDANVAGVWKFEHNFIQKSSSFAQAAETITNSDGEFYLPRVWSFTPWLATKELRINNLLVFKPGYDSSHPEKITPCKPKERCLIRLDKAKTHGEMKKAADFNLEIPLEKRHKIIQMIKTVNSERVTFGLKEREIK